MLLPEYKNGFKTTNFLIIILLSAGLLLGAFSSNRINAKIALNEEASKLGAETSFILQREDSGVWKEAHDTFTSNTENCPVSIAIPEDKNSVVLVITADGKFFRSQDYGRHFSQVMDLGYHSLAPAGGTQKCKVACGTSGVVYLFAKNDSSSIIGLSEDYGKTFRFKKLDFAVSDVFTLSASKNTVYFTFPEHVYFSKKQSSMSEGCYGFNFAKGAFVKVSGFYPGNYWASANIAPVHAYGSSLYFSFSNNEGVIYRMSISEDTSGVKFYGGFNPPLVQTFSKVGDFCVEDNGQMIIATDYGIFSADVSDNAKHGKVESINKVLAGSKLLEVTKNILIKPDKLVYDKEHRTVFMSTESNGLFADLHYKGALYWVAIPVFGNVNLYSAEDTDWAIDTLSVKNRFLLSPFIQESPPLSIYDLAILHSPYRIYLATNYGLVVLKLKEFH